MDNNKKFKIIIFVLSIICVILCGVIVFLILNDTQKNEEKDVTCSVVKEDDSNDDSSKYLKGYKYENFILDFSTMASHVEQNSEFSEMLDSNDILNEIKKTYTLSSDFLSISGLENVSIVDYIVDSPCVAIANILVLDNYGNLYYSTPESDSQIKNNNENYVIKFEKINLDTKVIGISLSNLFDADCGFGEFVILLSNGTIKSLDITNCNESEIYICSDNESNGYNIGDNLKLDDYILQTFSIIKIN